MGGKCFYVYFISHWHFEFWMDMNDVKPFSYYCDISVVALPKCVALSSHGGMIEKEIQPFLSLRLLFI